MKKKICALLSGLAASLLGGCNGDLAIREIAPKAIVLVDVTSHESFALASPCLVGQPSVTPLGIQDEISVDILRRVKGRLERDGYRVSVEKFPGNLDAKHYPSGYMTNPTRIYNSGWVPAFSHWLGELEAAHDAGAVVFLTPYYKSLSGLNGPFYSGMGVGANVRCLGIPLTSGKFYANVGVDVFTLPSNMRKFFTFDAKEACDVPLPDTVVDKLKAKTFTGQDMLQFRDVLVRIGSAQAEQELLYANVLHGSIDSCGAE